MGKLTLRYFHDQAEADVFVDRQIARRKRVSILKDAQRITVYSA